MSDSEDMTEFASIVERIERGEVSLLRMIYGPYDSSGLSGIMLPTAAAPCWPTELSGDGDAD